MSHNKQVSNHYTHGNLLGAIEAAVLKQGRKIEELTIEDLGAVDEFHIGGRMATEHLLAAVNFSEKDHILDLGCGLGGTSRFVAETFKSRVTGVDLTPEYVRTGNTLCSWLGLEGKVKLYEGNVLSLTFPDETFDGGLMLHVGMNIENKQKFFSEVNRVLSLGARFAVYDIMRVNEGNLIYPVPWATTEKISHLGTLDEYEEKLSQSGFDVILKSQRQDFALSFFKSMRKKAEAEGLPPLGLHLLMQESTSAKIGNMVANIEAGLIAPFEIIAQKARKISSSTTD